jgi:hypothetical protein
MQRNNILSFNVIEKNFINGKQIILELLTQLRIIHKNICEEEHSPPHSVNYKGLKRYIDLNDLANHMVSFDMDVSSFHDISMFDKCDNEEWLMLFSKCISLVDDHIDAIINNYKEQNYVIVNYELEKVITLFNDISFDLYCIIITHPEYIHDNKIKNMFISFAKFIKYMKKINNCIVNRKVCKFMKAG